MSSLLVTDWVYSSWFQSYVTTIALSLFGTLLIEIPLAFLLRVRGFENLKTVFIVNCLTNPMVVSIVFIFRWLSMSTAEIAATVVLEVVVVIVEGAVYRRKLTCKTMNPFLLSLLLNAASYGAGLLWTVLGK